MDEAEAKQAVRRQLLGPLRHSLRVGYDGKSWKLPGKSLKVHAELDAAVEEALAESRDGGLPGRLVRYVTGGSLDEQVGCRRHLLAARDQPLRAPGRPRGRPRSRRTRRSNRAPTRSKSWRPRTAASCATTCSPASSKRRCSTPTPITRLPPAPTTPKPEVTTKEVAAAYPSYLTLDRGTFTLRLWKDLKLAKTYTVAVGQEGLETPEGLYQSRKSRKTPPGTCPNRTGPASLAGQDIPPGPVEPDQGALDGRSSKAPASTAPKRPTRWAPPPRTAACGCRSRTWKSSTTRSKSARRFTSASETARGVRRGES